MAKGELIVRGRFEWFSEKSKANHKHGFTFEEAVDVFDDPYFFEVIDERHSTTEQERYNGFGFSRGKLKVIQMVFTEGERIHIISARETTAQERRMYFERLRGVYSDM